MKVISTLAVVTAIASSTAFAGTCDQPTFPGFNPSFNPAMQPATANYQPAYITDMRADMEQRGKEMRAEIAKRMSEARSEIEGYSRDARTGMPTAPTFARPDFAAMAPNGDPVKFMQEQRASAEKMMEEMRKNVAAPQFQAPQFQAPQFQAPVASIDPAEAQKAQKAWQDQQAAAMKSFEEQRKAYAEQAEAAAKQWQEQMKTQQEAMAAQQAAAAKRWEESRQQFAQAPAVPYQVSTPAFAPMMDQGAMMKQMEAQRAAAEKMMREAQERMQQQIQCRTI